MRSKIFTRTVGYWPLQEASGNALDYSGNENHANSTNVLSYGVSGPVGGNAMEFDGDDDVVRMKTQKLGVSGGTGMFTISAWINWGGSSDTIQGVFESPTVGDGLPGNPPYGIYLAGSNNDKVTLSIQDSSNNSNSVQYSQSINSGEWKLVTGVYDGSKARLFVDAEEVANGSVSDIYNVSPSRGAGIGTWKPSKGRFFDGKIAHVRVWDYPLPEASIRALYNASRGGFSESNNKTL